jgi:hypothetical protein
MNVEVILWPYTDGRCTGELAEFVERVDTVEAGVVEAIRRHQPAYLPDAIFQPNPDSGSAEQWGEVLDALGTVVLYEYEAAEGVKSCDTCGQWCATTSRHDTPSGEAWTCRRCTNPG